MNHALPLHHCVPFVDLFFRTQILPAHGHFKTIEEIGVPGLIASAQGGGAFVPRRIEVFTDVTFLFQYMAVGIDDRAIYHSNLLGLPTSLNTGLLANLRLLKPPLLRRSL